MASNYVGVPTFSSILSMLTDADPIKAATWRSTLERLLDNTVYLKTENDSRDRRSRMRAAVVQSKVLSSAVNDVGCAAFSRGLGYPTLLVKAGTNNTFSYSNQGQTTASGVSIASITSTVVGVAYDPANTRLVAIGTGSACSVSTDHGATWSAGGALGASRAIVWNKVNGRFVASRTSGNTISHSVDGASWTSVATSLATDVGGGVAVLQNGDMIACGADTGSATNPAFSRSANGGTSWTDTGGTVVSPALYADTGWVAGRANNNAGPTSGDAGQWVYHVGRAATGAWLRVARSADGVTWEPLVQIPASFDVGAAGTFSARPRLHICGNTNLMVIIAPYSTGVMTLLASDDGGLSWSSPAFGAATETYAYSTAGGRLFSCLATETFASIGIGL